MLWLPGIALSALEALVHGWMFTPVRNHLGRVIRANRRWPPMFFYAFWNTLRVLLVALLIYLAKDLRPWYIAGSALLYLAIHEAVFTPVLNLSRSLPITHLGRVSSISSGYDGWLYRRAGNWAFHLKMVIALVVGIIGYICLRLA